MKIIKDYSEARKILKQHDRKILGLHSLINGSSIQLKDGKWQLNVLATEYHHSFRLFEQINIDGLPVKVKVIGVLEALIVRTDKHRPAMPGISIGHPEITAGTLGAIVYKIANPETLYILSNNHVMADSNKADIGDQILQPGTYDGGLPDVDVIAHLSDFQTIIFEDEGPEANYMDAAIAAVPDRDDVLVGIEGIDNWAYEETGVYLEQSITKSGRTTAVTSGTVIEVSGLCRVVYSDPYWPFGRTALYDDQIFTDDISSGGDSGSLLIDVTTGKGVGLLFAGSSTINVWNKLDYIFARFDITFTQPYVEKEIIGKYDIVNTEVLLKSLYDIQEWELELKGKYYIGDSTRENPYPITTLRQLQDVGQGPVAYQNGHYYLACDIDATETETWNVVDGVAKGFKPITPPSPYRTLDFFDGNYNVIQNLYINRPEEDYVGLFGYVPEHYTRLFKNIYLDNVNITGKNYVGGVFGYAEVADISRCHVTGTIKGLGTIGGLVGHAEDSEIRESSTAGNFSADGTNLGGIVGYLEKCEMINSFSSANILDPSAGEIGGKTGRYGGLIGMLTLSKVEFCYADGHIDKDRLSDYGGLCHAAPSSFLSCYWNKESSGVEISGFGEGKTNAEMKQQSSFIGWDFLYIWYIIENVTPPQLRYPFHVVDLDEDSDAEIEFSAVQLTDRIYETAVATFEQEIISLSDKVYALSEAKDYIIHQLIYHKDIPMDADAELQQDISVTAGRLIDFDSDVTTDFEFINWTKFILQNKIYSTTYLFTLTGIPDGLNDFVCSISSFQARVRDDKSTYLSVIIPAQSDVMPDITDRSNGQMVVYMQYVFRDEILYNQEIIRVDLEDIRLDTGPVNSSITLTGHKTVEHASQVVNLKNPMMKRLINGKTYYRCEPDMFVRPGDVVHINDDTITIDMVTWSISATTNWMEIREA